MNKHIQSKNLMGQYHGYQQWYSFSNKYKLSYRAIWNNGKRIAYIECHLKQKTIYYI